MTLRLDWEHDERTGEASADLVCFDKSAPIRLRVRHGAHKNHERWAARLDVSNIFAYRYQPIAPDVPRAERVPDAVLAEAEAWAFANLRVCGAQANRAVEAAVSQALREAES